MGYARRTTNTPVADIKRKTARERECAALRHDRNAMLPRPKFKVVAKVKHGS